MRRLPGSHAPNARNRSSKNLTWLTKIRPLVRCMSNEELSKTNAEGASKEIERRKKISNRNEIKKQKYLEKLAAKRGNSSK